MQQRSNTKHSKHIRSGARDDKEHKRYALPALSGIGEPSSNAFAEETLLLHGRMVLRSALQLFLSSIRNFPRNLLKYIYDHLLTLSTVHLARRLGYLKLILSVGEGDAGGC